MANVPQREYLPPNLNPLVGKKHLGPLQYGIKVTSNFKNYLLNTIRQSKVPQQQELRKEMVNEINSRLRDPSITSTQKKALQDLRHKLNQPLRTPQPAGTHRVGVSSLPQEALPMYENPLHPSNQGPFRPDSPPPVPDRPSIEHLEKRQAAINSYKPHLKNNGPTNRLDVTGLNEGALKRILDAQAQLVSEQDGNYAAPRTAVTVFVSVNGQIKELTSDASNTPVLRDPAPEAPVRLPVHLNAKLRDDNNPNNYNIDVSNLNTKQLTVLLDLKNRADKVKISDSQPYQVPGSILDPAVDPPVLYVTKNGQPFELRFNPSGEPVLTDPLYGNFRLKPQPLGSSES